MIHIAWPWMALLLPLPWLVRRVAPPAATGAVALFLPFVAALAPTGAEDGRRGARRALALFGVLWLLLVAAAVRPQWLGDPQPVPTTGRRVLMAIDVSGSMQTRDMAGSLDRLQVVQQVAGRFIARRHGDRVGLILFGTRPYLQAPLTPDLATVREFLDQAVVGEAGPQTALGDAIGLALKRLRDDPRGAHKGDTVLILLTDGRNTAGVMPPVQAARHAADAGLKIYTIGVGGAPERGFFGLFGGSRSDLDEATLKAIAEATGGAYFRATDAAALRQVYARIDALEPAAGRDQWYRPATEYYDWPLAAALVLSIPLALAWARRGA
ncbi:VWA domain-containing protein [Nitrogeniibacter mangrovi]|uniref:VWA domain-containing protein n=1 Tax=Nitrogeniibacter mangrovi TaxID=2016596 RepID=A0A6C1B0M2_9RHOO|nr:VWA domain-containing protein [Nitrogeniibacter mangrovi]QID16923.1 VWA domain-containing protein [Nitrogeniibacter mangrovi]